MFREAYAKAAQFTEPVMYFWKCVGGELGVGLGALVVVNPEGWVVTAGHVVLEASKLVTAETAARDWEARRDAIDSDASINRKEKSRQFKALGRLSKDAVSRAAIRWGHHATNLVDVTVLQSIDLAVGRLEPFDSDWVTEHPVFKDPSKDDPRGTSLCKLGFPFVEIKPTFDETTDTFDIPSEMLAIPFFPIEGIYTRRLLVPAPNPPPPYPLTYIETSSPGLKGQSGGPTLDENGVVWAIQSQTKPLPLGFSPEVNSGGRRIKEHQFLNVGMGVHVETVLGLFNELGIKHSVADY